MTERDGYEHGVPCWVDTWQPDADAAGRVDRVLQRPGEGVSAEVALDAGALRDAAGLFEPAELWAKPPAISPAERDMFVSATRSIPDGTRVSRGDVVMTVVGSRPEWAYAMLACWRLGAVAQPCTEQLRPKDLRMRLDVTRLDMRELATVPP